MNNPLPQEFINSITNLLGEEEAQALLQSLDLPSPTSIRLSQNKGNELTAISSIPVPWCPWGYYLSERPIFTGDPRFHGGLYYVQEASSMLLYQIKPILGDSPITALDLCAAPGGKSTLLLDLLPEGSVLVSNEIIRHRANILTENLQKWGSTHSIVTSCSPAILGQIEQTYDLILVDAPCSGEGMFRKDDEARSEWSPSSPSLCADRQRSILSDIWASLKDDGILIYSTCTMNREENEDILDYIIHTLGATPIDLGHIEGGVWKSPFSEHPCYRMLPHRVDGEGLFMAVLRKINLQASTAVSNSKKPSKAQRRSNSKTYDVPKELHRWLVNSPLPLHWLLCDDVVYALPENILPIYQCLRAQNIKTISAGIPIAHVKGKDYLPHPALALSQALNRDAFECVEISDEQLIPYLSRESITLDHALSKGIKLITHKSIPLGFVKHLGNRCNNLYPQEWRIRNAAKIKRQ